MEAVEFHQSRTHVFSKRNSYRSSKKNAKATSSTSRRTLPILHTSQAKKKRKKQNDDKERSNAAASRTSSRTTQQHGQRLPTSSCLEASSSLADVSLPLCSSTTTLQQRIIDSVIDRDRVVRRCALTDAASAYVLFCCRPGHHSL